MIYWDREASRRKFKARLAAVSGGGRLFFACGALQHAWEIVGAAGGSGRLVVLAGETLEVAWRAAHGHHVDLGDLKERLRDAQPGEDESPEPGATDLLDGATALCRTMTQPRADTALEVASFAYQAVMDRFMDKVASAGGEETFERVERATPECLAEVGFQEALLQGVEQAVSGDLAWDALRARLSATQTT